MEVVQNILGIINKCPIELRPTTAFAYMFLASFSHTIQEGLLWWYLLDIVTITYAV